MRNHELEHATRVACDIAAAKYVISGLKYDVVGELCNMIELVAFDETLSDKQRVLRFRLLLSLIIRTSYAQQNHTGIVVKMKSKRASRDRKFMSK